jgi:hypothetical protein
MDSARNFRSICAIIFVTSLCSILLIDLKKDPKISPQKLNGVNVLLNYMSFFQCEDLA